MHPSIHAFAVRSLSAAVEGLEMDKEALTNDAQYWQQRLTQLTERYNEVGG